jgi:hypothetical protein
MKVVCHLDVFDPTIEVIEKSIPIIKRKEISHKTKRNEWEISNTPSTPSKISKNAPMRNQLNKCEYNVNHDISKRYSDHPQQTENFDVAKNMHFITLK